MKVKIKKFHKDAKMPQKAYDKDFCYDVYAVSEEEISPNVWKYGLGFGLQIERGDTPPLLDRFATKNIETDEDFKVVSCGVFDLNACDVNLSIDVRPRSSVWKTGMMLSNSVGTVDEGYCNEISAVFYHVLPNMPRYKVGDKIAQIKIGTTFPIEFAEVEEFNKTERGMRGYGSSGK